MTRMQQTEPERLMPLEQTHSFLKLAREWRRQALPEALRRAEQTVALSRRIEALQGELATTQQTMAALEAASQAAKAEIARASRGVVERGETRRAERSQRLAQANAALDAASSQRSAAAGALHQARLRVTDLQAGRLTPADTAWLDQAHPPELAGLRARQAHVRSRLGPLQAAVAERRATLDQLPPATAIDAEIVGQVAERAAEFDRRTAELEAEQVALGRRRDEAVARVERLTRQAIAQREDAEEHHALLTGTAMRRLTSKRWWELQGKDHAAVLQATQQALQAAEQAAAAATAATLMQAAALAAHRAKQPEILAATREAAYATSLARQVAAQEREIARLTAARDHAIEAERHAEAEVERLATEIASVQAAWAETRPALLLSLAADTVVAAEQALQAADAAVVAAQAQVRAAVAEHDALARQLEDEIAAAEQAASARLADAESRLRAADATRAAAASARDALEQEALALAEEHRRFADAHHLPLASFPILPEELHRLRRDLDTAPAASAVIQAVPGSVMPREGDANLYINLDKFRDKLARDLRGLREQLGVRLFPGWPADRLVEALRDVLLPEGQPQGWLIGNLSLAGDAPLLSLRPALIGPRLEAALPPGVTLVLRGGLTDNRNANVDNPLFAPDAVTAMAASPAREFERAIDACAFSGNTEAFSVIYPARSRVGNVLDTTLIGALPLISRTTQRRLEGWRGYLAWRRNLTLARMLGLRFVAANAGAGRWRFAVVGESREAVERAVKRPA